MKLNRTLAVAAIAACALASAPAGAQTKKLAPKDGEAFRYEASITSNQTLSMGGSDMTAKTVLALEPRVAAAGSAADRINWNVDLGNVHVSLAGDMLPIKKVDTTIGTVPIVLVTDRKGEMISETGDRSKDPTRALLGNSLGALLLNNWFSPLLARDAKPGDSWEVVSSDSVVNGLVGIMMKTASTIRYTHGGLVDTLGVKCARIYGSMTKYSVNGSGSFSGMSMEIEGDGTATLVSYYNTKDGLLQASAIQSDGTMRMAVGGGQEMVMPIATRLAGSVVRAGAQAPASSKQTPAKKK